MNDDFIVTSEEELDSIFGEPHELVKQKELLVQELLGIIGAGHSLIASKGYKAMPGTINRE
jgi:hypothetical protein